MVDLVGRPDHDLFQGVCLKGRIHGGKESQAVKGPFGAEERWFRYNILEENRCARVYLYVGRAFTQQGRSPGVQCCATIQKANFGFNRG